MAKQRNDTSIFNALLYIVVGVLFIVFKHSMLEWLLTVVGVLFIVFGIIDIVRGGLLSGIISIILGIVIILGGWLFIQVVLIIFGVLLTIKGVLGFFTSFKPFSLLGIIFSALTVFIGVLLIVATWQVVDWYYIVIGVVFIVSGVFELFGFKFIR